MPVWSVCARKGGVGKTTIAQCLAIEALREGQRAAIVDLDPQQSALAWGSARTTRGLQVPAVVAAGRDGVRGAVRSLRAQGAAVIVIDTPPLVTPELHAALEVSDAAIMPTRPNPMDLDALIATWEIVQGMKRLRPAAIVTQAPPGTRVKALSLSLARLRQVGIPTCPTALTYSISYPYAQAEALALQEREPTSKPRAELAEIWGWLRRERII